MAIGQGQLLGQGVDPRLFVQDFSGFVNAANTRAQGMANLGSQIGSTIKGLTEDYENKKKEESQINALKKSTESRIDSALNLFGDKMPGLAEQLQSQKALLNDPNISLYEQGLNASTIASEIDNTLNMLLQSQQMNIRQAAADRAAATPIITPKTGGSNYTVP
jgi:hypothetical protein